MMLCLSLHDSLYPEQDPGQLTVSRIEVFVIPALAIDNEGYRVCLRLTTEHGYGWSEVFLAKQDYVFFEPESWGKQLQGFIGRFPLSSLTTRLTEMIAGKADADNRAFSLFAAALGAIQQQYASGVAAESSAIPAEESVLQLRSISYISLD